MLRQSWWPEPIAVNETSGPTTRWMARIREADFAAMDAAWRERIVNLYEGPYPDVEDDVELLSWFVTSLLKKDIE